MSDAPRGHIAVYIYGMAEPKALGALLALAALSRFNLIAFLVVTVMLGAWLIPEWLHKLHLLSKSCRSEAQPEDRPGDQ